MGQSVPYRRNLTEEDLLRMRLPRRYWNARFDQISDDAVEGAPMSVRDGVRRYLEQAEEMVRSGHGLLLWGANGTGKTCIAAVIAKEFRRRGNPVLFMEAADMKRFVVEREMFDEDQTYWDRAMNVTVLVIDDFGKGAVDDTGFGSRLMDELVRHRNAHRLVTIITTNYRTKALGEVLMASTMASLKEHVAPVEVVGADRREAVAHAMAATLRE